MAKNNVEITHRHVKEKVAYGLFISVLGCLWLVAEMGWIQTIVPIGPVIIIILGFVMFLPWIRSD